MLNNFKIFLQKNGKKIITTYKESELRSSTLKNRKTIPNNIFSSFFFNCDSKIIVFGTFCATCIATGPPCFLTKNTNLNWSKPKISILRPPERLLIDNINLKIVLYIVCRDSSCYRGLNNSLRLINFHSYHFLIKFSYCALN